MKNKEAAAPEQQLDLEVVEEANQELDLEDEVSEDTDSEEENKSINIEVVYQKLKPDFVEVLNLLKYKVEGKDEDEAVENLLAAQKEFESFLKNKIVKKIKANVTAQVAQSTQKPGQKINNNRRERKTTPFA